MPGANIAGGSDALYDPAGEGGKLSSTRQRQSRRALYTSRDGAEIKRRAEQVRNTKGGVRDEWRPNK
jgi:hypothetical protein